MAMNLTQYIGEPVSGYESSPAHTARFIANEIHKRSGSWPQSIHQSRGYAYRVVLQDGRRVLVNVAFGPLSLTIAQD